MIAPAFLVAAGLAVLVALAFVLIPVLRQDPETRKLRRRLNALDDLTEELEPADLAARRQRLEKALREKGERSGGPGLLLGLLIVVPLATILLYRAVGEPAGIESENSQVAQIRAVLIELANSLERNPDNIDNWVRLGLSYKDLREFSSAEHALRRALYLDDSNPFIQIELAETLLFGSGSTNLPGEAVKLLEQAVATDPESQKALWLLGIHAFQNNDRDRALARWEQLEALLEPGSVRDSVRAQMARARQSGGSLASSTATTLPPDHPPIAPASDPVFPVTVSIAPTLADQLSGSETVFLIARAVNGPPAPLAVRRLTVADLPIVIHLSDHDGMVEGLTLSAFPNIRLTARVSISGQAEPQPGDLEGETGPISIIEQTASEVLINRQIQARQD